MLYFFLVSIVWKWSKKLVNIGIWLHSHWSYFLTAFKKSGLYGLWVLGNNTQLFWIHDLNFFFRSVMNQSHKYYFSNGNRLVLQWLCIMWPEMWFWSLVGDYGINRSWSNWWGKVWSWTYPKWFTSSNLTKPFPFSFVYK